MEKFVSVRPTRELISVFQQAGPDGVSSRTDLFNQALCYLAQKNDPEEVVRASRMKIEITYEGELPSSFKLRIEDDQVYSRVVELFRRAFGLERVQGRLLVTLTMLAWRNRGRGRMLEDVDKAAVRCDPLVFKIEFETSKEEKKHELFRLAKIYLGDVNPELGLKLREWVETWIRGISDYYNGAKYLPPRRLGGTTLPYMAKIYAGIILCLTEIEQWNLNDLLEELSETCDSGRP